MTLINDNFLMFVCTCCSEFVHAGICPLDNIYNEKLNIVFCPLGNFN